MSQVTYALTRPQKAMLRAVAAGHAEFVWSSEPDLMIDGRFVNDQPAAHELSRAGLVQPATPVAFGTRVAARLTDVGHALLVSF
jgi:hypothetical protein